MCVPAEYADADPSQVLAGNCVTPTTLKPLTIAAVISAP